MFWVKKKRSASDLFIHFIYVFVENLHKCRAIFCAVGNSHVGDPSIPFICMHFSFVVISFIVWLVLSYALLICFSSSFSFLNRVLGHTPSPLCDICLHICEARSQINWVVCVYWLAFGGQANKPSSKILMCFLFCFCFFINWHRHR